jgi:probable rRNA maturation factor
MSLDVDVATVNVRAPLSRAAIATIARRALQAERVRDALLSVTLVDAATMARLNRTHLRHSGATDVISFQFNRVKRSDAVVGDVYICPVIARRNAATRDTTLREELSRLVIHGVLHVLGYDHPDDDRRERSRMWRRQEHLVRRLAPRPARSSR